MAQKYIVEADENGTIVSEPVPYNPSVAQAVKEHTGLSTYIGWGITTLFLLILVYKSFVVVKQQTASIIERLGKFRRVAKAGLSFKIPFFDRVVGETSLQIQELNVAVETKTKDNVFVNVVIAVQYYILEDKVFEAFYKLSDPNKQINSYVFDTVRSFVPTVELDEVFSKQDDIATKVIGSLKDTMEGFGYGIVKSLVTDISPNEKVKNAMNEINEQQRLREAATAKGEAEKVLVVKKAEAEAESKRLQGEGIAAQRKAIAKGIEESLETLKKTGIKSEEANSILLMVQYFDTIKDIGTNEHGARTIFLPSSPGGLKEISTEIRNAMLVAKEG